MGGRLPEAEDESPQEGESLGVGVNFQEEKTEGNNNLKEGGTLDQRSEIELSSLSLCLLMICLLHIKGLLLML